MLLDWCEGAQDSVMKIEIPFMCHPHSELGHWIFY